MEDEDLAASLCSMSASGLRSRANGVRRLLRGVTAEPLDAAEPEELLEADSEHEGDRRHGRLAFKCL